MAGLPPRMAERAPELMTSSAPLPPPPDAHCARRAGMNPTRSPESDTDGTYVNIPKYTPPAVVPINTDPQSGSSCGLIDTNSEDLKKDPMNK